MKRQSETATTTVSQASETQGQVHEALDRDDRRAALDLLMTSYGTAVYRFCRQMLGNDDLAADVHQTTFVQAYEGLGRFRRDSSLRTWLFSIARHRCLDAAKALRRRQARIENTSELPETPADDPGADDRLSDQTRNRMLEHCLDKLRPKVRTAVVLRFQQDLSYPEMARVIGERPPTLQARVARAMPMLRRCLEAGGLAA